MADGISGPVGPCSPQLGPRRGGRAEVGQIPNPPGEVAPAGTVGEPTAKTWGGQLAKGRSGGPGIAAKCQR
jgi:hypothetical protein